MKTTVAPQKKTKTHLQNLRQDRKRALNSLSKQPKMSSAEAIANYKHRQKQTQQTREAV
jgi:uncharacterized protein YbjQ (UPF0145 family)